MSEQEPRNNTDLVTNERAIALKEREITLKEQEIKAKIELDKRGMWFSSPLLIGVFSAIFGLLGTGIGAALQGYLSLQLERQKFESSLIQKALEIEERKEAAKTLLFLVESGVIQSLDRAKIRKIAENPEQLPALAQQLLLATSRGGAIAPSPDGKTFIVGDADGSTTIWSVDGTMLSKFLGHRDAVTTHQLSRTRSSSRKNQECDRLNRIGTRTQTTRNKLSQRSQKPRSDNSRTRTSQTKTVKT